MKRIFQIVIVLVLLLLAVPITNLIIGLPETSLVLADTGDPDWNDALQVLGRKCVNCHSNEHSLPFYAGLPPAKGMIEADMKKGMRYIDLGAQLLPKGGAQVSEVTLAQVERVILDGTMPPSRYRLLHWNGGLRAAEEETVLGWVRKARIEHYATGTASKRFAAEPLQPVPDAIELNPAKVALGDTLFHDVRLSRDDTLSCASCHDLDKGGTDHARYSTGVGGSVGEINSPTVFNSGFHFVQSWDGRAKDLEEQADGMVNSPIELASNWPDVISKFEKDIEFATAFFAVYRDGLEKESFLDAIATFVRSLITPDSRFDKFLKGGYGVIDYRERQGYELFKSFSCANCHVGTSVGGQAFQKMGRAADYFGARGEVTKPDQGRFNVTNQEGDRYCFKVPTLRNIDLTGPYFHDGTVENLGEAVRTMVRVQVGRAITDDEVAKILAFLSTLTGEYRGKLLE